MNKNRKMPAYAINYTLGVFNFVRKDNLYLDISPDRAFIQFI